MLRFGCSTTTKRSKPEMLRQLHSSHWEGSRATTVPAAPCPDVGLCARAKFCAASAPCNHAAQSGLRPQPGPRRRVTGSCFSCCFNYVMQFQLPTHLIALTVSSLSTHSHVLLLPRSTALLGWGKSPSQAGSACPAMTHGGGVKELQAAAGRAPGWSGGTSVSLLPEAE